ncbi:DUF559 domain-containing protein [Gordonia sp. SID5947]|uniref:DUF559 domain-containing protein n=1 Tax=Gordonia sp. SID5947 TaxID=2690315 RepID=UPI00136F1534|nr:DUF559 domain-containing protein [Gordonia sp. SID5947]MYR08520.1 DUF559 domain-containing protein [Gordonia sp. SID5947]
MDLTDLHIPYGVASWAQLRSLGVTQTDLRRARKDGDLRLLRRGWYATRTADTSVAAAVTSGGVVSCVSALRLHGVWTPPGPSTMHIRGREAAHRSGKRRYCKQYAPPEREVDAVDEIRIALRHALKCLDDEGIVVVRDSILHQDLLERCDIDAEFVGAPRRIRRLLDRCDAKAESGTESMVRLRLRALGIRVRTQYQIAGVGRVDLLVGDRLIIEIDSVEYHDRSPDQIEKDRRRDEEATRLGYVTLRFSYQRVVHEWEHAEATVLDLVRRREHLKQRVVSHR